MRTIAVVNQKGGCGKTTTTINLSAILANRGHRTLIVDMDPQSHCAAGLGVPEEHVEKSIADALLATGSDSFDPHSVIWDVSRNLDLAPSTMRLAGLEAPGGGLHSMPDRDQRLSKFLARLKDRYDWCVIDCPPTIGLLTFSALRASRETLIPVETGFFSLRGAQKQWNTVQRLIERIDQPIVCHLLPSLHKPDSKVSRDILRSLERRFAGQIIPVVIREHEAIRAATSFGQPITEYAPHDDACHDFESLADWLIEHGPRRRCDIEVHASGAQLPERLQFTNPNTAAAFSQRFGAGTSAPVSGNTTQGAVAGGRVAELLQRMQRYQDSAETRAQESPEHTPAPQEALTSATSQIEAKPDPDVQAQADHGLPTQSKSACPSTATSFGAEAVDHGVRLSQPAGLGRVVCVAGDFNQWSTTATRLTPAKDGNSLSTVVKLPPGRYQYRLVVDGRWQRDRYNDQIAHNAWGETNSVIVIQEAKVTT